MVLALLARCPRPSLSLIKYVGSLEPDCATFVQQSYKVGIDFCFGLELRAAFRLDLSHAQRSDIRRPPFRQILLRPAIEPILLSFCKSLSPTELEVDAVDRFMSCVHGVPMERRVAGCRISPYANGNFVQFPDSDYADRYHERLLRDLSSIEDPIARAGYVYAQVLLSHPYADGNGRLARAMVLATLSEAFDGRVPMLPLGPVSYARAPELADALQVLAATGNWLYFMMAFESLLKDSLGMARLLLGLPRHTS